MSSVGKNGEIQRLKEYYSQREAELEGKHKKMIEDLKETHSAEFQNYKNRSEGEVEESKSRMRERLTDMDMKHQKEIESLQKIYQKKLEDSRRG